MIGSIERCAENKKQNKMGTIGLEKCEYKKRTLE
jgi:hypothetical protein